MGNSAFNEYEYWRLYLKSAKNGHDRPIKGRANHRVIKGPGDSIRLRYHHTDVVALHPDGTFTLCTGGWNTVTTIRFIREHTPAQVYSEGGSLFVRFRNPEYTKPKVRKCRRCKDDGYNPISCAGPAYCSVGELLPNGQYVAKPCGDHGRTGRHQKDQCHHGETGAHELPPVKCRQCRGVGSFDYGSKPINYEWGDGHEPILIDNDGYFAGLSYHFYGKEPLDKPVQATVTSGSYIDSGDRLKAILPGLSAQANSPVDGRRNTLTKLIIDLNDRHRWTREQIADWLDTLDVDLTFPVPDTIPARVS